MPITGYTGVKVFTATLAKDRDALGETITRWLDQHLDIEIVDTVAMQSSDEAFHCVTICLFFRQRPMSA